MAIVVVAALGWLYSSTRSSKLWKLGETLYYTAAAGTKTVKRNCPAVTIYGGKNPL